MGRAIYTIKGESTVEFKVYDGTRSHLGSIAPGRTILVETLQEKTNIIELNLDLTSRLRSVLPDEILPLRRSSRPAEREACSSS
jgi:hypothetical protein